MLFEKFRAIEGLLKTENLGINKYVTELAKIIGCNVYLVNADGEIISFAAVENIGFLNGRENNAALKPEFKQRLGFVFDTTANLPLESCFLLGDHSVPANIFMTLIPVRNNRATSSHLILLKQGQFSQEELLLAETAALVTCIYRYEQDSEADCPDSRQKSNAMLVLNSLSFSELKAISNVFTDLNSSEGFLVASKVADRIGISRSVIVNAMRKLESAGVVESRSLGIKGTYIKIKNHHFVDALFERVK